jgi:hypothetical protein
MYIHSGYKVHPKKHNIFFLTNIHQVSMWIFRQVSGAAGALQGLGSEGLGGLASTAVCLGMMMWWFYGKIIGKP